MISCDYKYMKTLWNFLRFCWCSVTWNCVSLFLFMLYLFHFLWNRQMIHSQCRIVGRAVTVFLSSSHIYHFAVAYVFIPLCFLLFILLHILKNRINYELRMSVPKERLLALHSMIQYSIKIYYYLTVNRLVGPRNNKRNQHLALLSEEKIWNKCSA